MAHPQRGRQELPPPLRGTSLKEGGKNSHRPCGAPPSKREASYKITRASKIAFCAVSRRNQCSEPPCAILLRKQRRRANPRGQPKARPRGFATNHNFFSASARGKKCEYHLIKFVRTETLFCGGRMPCSLPACIHLSRYAMLCPMLRMVCKPSSSCRTSSGVLP